MEMTLTSISNEYGLALPTSVSSREGWDFNCMGFAFGTYEWDCIDGFTEFDECVEGDYEGYEEYLDVELPYGIESVLNCYDGVREVSLDDELAPDEYLVAMRYAQTDFHFMRQMSDGTWIEKCGAAQFRQHTKDILNEVWISPNGTNEYDSKIIYFAVTDYTRYYVWNDEDEEDCDD